MNGLTLDRVGELLSLPLFALGGAKFTTLSLLGVIASLVLLYLFAGWLSRWLQQRLSRHANLAAGTTETIATLSRYAVLALGLLIILDEVGIQPSSFTVLVGALGVGVGFGLQNIFSNFISGLIVMFEQPVKLGDHISVSGAEGDVVHIGLRATTLRTGQGSAVIVPNQNLITSNVINWSVGTADAVVLQWHLSGAIDEDEALVLRVLKNCPGVEPQPEPAVYVATVDHGGQTLEAHFRIAGGAEARLKVIGDVNRRMLAELKAAGQSLS